MLVVHIYIHTQQQHLHGRCRRHRECDTLNCFLQRIKTPDAMANMAQYARIGRIMCLSLYSLYSRCERV